MADPVFAITMEFVSGSYTNVTTDVRRFTVSRSFGTALTGIRGGDALIEFDNAARKYSPANSGSPYYPGFRPRTNVKIQATHSGSTYNLFHGRTRALTVDPKLGSRVAIVDAQDALTHIDKVTLVTSLFQDINPASLFTVIMSQCAVNSFATDVFDATDEIGFAWYRDRNALNAIAEIVEFGRYGVYQDGGGTIRLQNRYFGIGGSVVASLDGALDIGWHVEDSLAINKVRVQAQPRRVSTTVNTVAWLGEILSIPASSGIGFWLTYVDPVEVSLPTPAMSLTSPVATTDFLANTQSDGAGTNRTATLSAACVLFAETAICSLYNGSADQVFITMFKIRGYSVQKQPLLTSEAENSSSQAVYGRQEFTLTSPLMSRREYVQEYAKSLVRQRKDPLSRLDIALKNEWPYGLAMEPGQIIALNDPETATNNLLTVLSLQHQVNLQSGLEHIVSLETEISADYPLDAADFDGTNDYLTRGAGLTGAADSKKFTYVHWLRQSTNSGGRYMLEGETSFSLRMLTTGLLVLGRNSANTVILQLTSSALTVADGWKCVMISVDLAASPALIYFNDTSALLTTTTFTNDTIDFTRSDWGFGHTISTPGASLFNGFMGPMFLWLGVKADFTSEAVRRLFCDSAGKPVDPTAAIAALGTPICRHYLAYGEAPANYAINRGSGGDYAITGTLTTAANSPSD